MACSAASTLRSQSAQSEGGSPTSTASGSTAAPPVPEQSSSALPVNVVSYAATSAEVSAGISPTNTSIPTHATTGLAYVERYGAAGDGVTDDSAAFLAACRVAISAQCPIGLMAKTYVAAVSMRASGIGIVGPGSSSCTIRNPPSGLSLGGVIEVGDTSAGNSATPYDRFVAHGFTIDGNRSVVAPPSDDLHGHGLVLTSITHFHISDVRAVNCHNAGVLLAINSNYGYVDCYVENCGNPWQTAVGFDINSSKCLIVNVIAVDCPEAGARILDNCFGIAGSFSVYNAGTIGVVYCNQPVNESHDNNVTIAVDGGCIYAGVQINSNCRNSQLRITVYDVLGVGVQEVYVTDPSQRPTSNTYFVNTSRCSAQSALIGGDGGAWHITSFQDGRGGAPGSVFAVQVDGSRNNISASITDSATPQVRGISMTEKSSANNLIAFTRNSLVSEWQDIGIGNFFSPRILRASAQYSPPPIRANDCVSTTIAVSGAETESGDIAQVQFSRNIKGIAVYAEVTDSGVVTAWLSNQTNIPVSLPSMPLYAVVTKATP